MLARNFDSRFVSEENTLSILDIINPDHYHSPTPSKHFAERSLRLLTTVYSEIRLLFLENESQNSKSLPLTISSSSLSYARCVVRYTFPPPNTESTTFVCLFLYPEFVHQWALSINSFLAIINSSHNDPHLEQSFHAHTFFRHCLHGSTTEPIFSRTNDNLDSKILTHCLYYHRNICGPK